MIITYEIDIQAPIDKVFALLRDMDKQKKWMPGLEGTEYVTTFDPSHPVGTRFKQKMREGKRVEEYEGEVIEYEENQMLGVRLLHSSAVIEVIYRLEEQSNNSCRLHLTEKIEAKGTLNRVMMFLFRGIAKSALKKQIVILKENAEMS